MVITQQFRTIPAKRGLLQPVVAQRAAAATLPAHALAGLRPALPIGADWLNRGIRLPNWVMALAIGTSLAGALALPLQHWDRGSASAAPAGLVASPIGYSTASGMSGIVAPAGADGGSSSLIAPTQDVEAARGALAQLTDEFQRAQRDNAGLRNAVQAQAQQLTAAQAQQSLTDQQRQDDVSAVGSQYQAQVSQLQGQLAGAAQSLQEQLGQLDQSVSGLEKLDAALRAKAGLAAISYGSTTIPDLKTASDPQSAAQAALDSLQTRLDSVNADLNTVSAKAGAQAKGQLQSVATATGQFIWPTSGTITQPFGPTSLSLEPAYLGYAHFHQGLDIANSMYTPIVAADSGTVIFAGWTNAGYGNCVQIDHGNGLITLYGHMAQTPMVSVGQHVAKGQQIGVMGSTGASTGPHLHFAVLKNGVWTDPSKYLP